MTEKESRSSTYQYLIVETPFPDDFICKFNNSDSLEGHLNPYMYDEEILNLQDLLNKRVWEVIEENCTQTQLEIMKMVYIKGMTQVEIAKARNKNQSSIQKSLSGNTRYEPGKGRTPQGGALRKIKNILLKDPEFTALSQKISELQELRF